MFSMQKINYQKKLIEFIKNLDGRPKLLLHCCCAPCASAVIDFLHPYFEITAYFYNPNITDESEYNKRLGELVKLCKIYNVELVAEKPNNKHFYNLVIGKENEKEGGARCDICIADRLKTASNMADFKGFDYFTTTLSISPHKNSEFINQTGIKLSSKYLPADFKKNEGFKKSIELCKKYNIYRQTYCGCKFSKNDL